MSVESDLYERGVRMGWCLAYAYLGFKVPDEDLTEVLAQPAQQDYLPGPGRRVTPVRTEDPFGFYGDDPDDRYDVLG